MNYKARSLRAGIAVAILVIVGLLGADAFGQYRAGADYNYDAFAIVAIAGLSVVFVLFLWNAVQYSLKHDK